MNGRDAITNTLLLLCLLMQVCPGAERTFYVSPTGSDDSPGTGEAPFRTVHRAQVAMRGAVGAMDGDIVVSLAPGTYRLDKRLELTDADSGRNGHRVIYRSAGGLGKARLLGSVPLTGWEPHRDGIWKIALPEGMTFHTLYEAGKRAWKARFPNYQHHARMPAARGRYLVSVDGSAAPKDGEKSGWLTYRPEDAPPVTQVITMKIALFAVGKCNWMRTIHSVQSFQTEKRRVLISGRIWRGVGKRARYFYEDELGLLDAPGEFYVDQAAHTLYYHPLSDGHPDTLEISAPVVTRLIQIRGKSRDACAENLMIDGLALEETDGFPKGWWGMQYGRTDGALIWMNNTRRVEIKRCHLRNGGRSGIMLIGHNTDNLVSDCWIEHMGVNGVTLSNRFSIPDEPGAARDRCERNRVYNCRIHDIGEIHCYAACVNVFNVSHNEVSHCELYDSVRYAVTVRGNTGAQFGPPVSVNMPSAKGNHFHHLRVVRCGQDSGDMGALHCANLNNPDGDAINTFEQITVAGCQAIPSMKDIAPDGIFLDWPKMSMHQIFRNMHILRCQGRQIRSHRPENAASAQTENVSWKAGFRTDLMDYENIGLTHEFPAEYGHPSPLPKPLAAPHSVKATANAYDTVSLEWKPPSHKPEVEPIFAIYRDGKKISDTRKLRFIDHGLSERTTYRYRVSARVEDFRKPSPRSQELAVETPADLVPPRPTGARLSPDGERVRVAFSEAVEPASALKTRHYRFTPELTVKAVKTLTPECVDLVVEGAKPGATYALSVVGLRDLSSARNLVPEGTAIELAKPRVIVSYPLKSIYNGRLKDASGGGGDARVHGAAVVEPNGGPLGGAALRLDGKTAYAEAPRDLNLGAGDFTIMVWVHRVGTGIILSKGNGFGSQHQWSLGWPMAGEQDSICLRIKNNFFSTGEGSVPEGRWVHVAFVKKETIARAYINGKASGKEHDLSGLGPFVNDRPLRIGRREHAPDPRLFNGKIAGVVLVDDALLPAQIRAHAAGSGDSK